jgi:hypothetical protein
VSDKKKFFANVLIMTLFCISSGFVRAHQKLSLELIQARLKDTAAEALGLNTTPAVSAIEPTAQAQIDKIIRTASLQLYYAGADEQSLKQAQAQFRKMMENLLLESAIASSHIKQQNRSKPGHPGVDAWDKSTYRGVVRITSTAVSALLQSVCPVYPFCPSLKND